MSKHFLLTADIRFDSADFAPGGGFYSSGGGFIPIGRGQSTNLRFKGSFDGRNFVVSGLRINRPSGAKQAMFGETDSGSEIRNIRLENVDLSGSEYVAGLVGRCLGRIADASVTGVVRAGNPTQTSSDLDAAGGVAGEILGGGTIENSKAAVVVTGTGMCVGGLAGSSDGLIRNSSASGKVDAVPSAIHPHPRACEPFQVRDQGRRSAREPGCPAFRESEILLRVIYSCQGAKRPGAQACLDWLDMHFPPPGSQPEQRRIPLFQARPTEYAEAEAGA